MLDTGAVVGGYRIEELLGRGGMGAVFRARDIESGRTVALKVMAEGSRRDPSRDARFRGEGRAQALLDHPHVVTVYDAGESEHGLYLAMRLIDGPPLVELIRERQLHAKRALDLLGQVADALDAAHAMGLVHRDVKAHNVLVGEGDHAFLADFGLTRTGADPSLTASGGLVGTVAYLAPEVVRGGEATPASDRYAFAAVAFECLTGSVVFPRTSNASVLFAHANDPPPRISARRPELGSALDDLFERALAKDPAERPDTARQLVDAVRHDLEQTGAIELPPPAMGAAALDRDQAVTDSVVPAAQPVASRLPRSRRSTIGPAAAAALAGSALAALAWLALDRDPAAPTRSVAPDQPGLQYIGSPLDGPAARALDCRGHPPGASSPACTVVQTALPGATVVVPRNGVIRDWQVRGASGELTLVVTRPREGGSFQVSTSNTEAVGSADVQSFDADIDVERGDLVGVRLTAGSAVGVRDGWEGATTQRWLPPLTGLNRPADRGAATGFDHEVLLRVGLLPGGKRRPVRVVSGAEAARLPAARVRKRRSLRLDGRRIDFVLVQVGDGFAIDQFTDGRRASRMNVPGLRPGAQVTRFLAAVWAPDQAGLDLNYVNEGSARVVQRTYVLAEGRFQVIR